MTTDIRAAFTRIYEREAWGKGKGSGTGSSPKYCALYLDYLRTVLRPGMRVLDLGCGDWQLFNGWNFWGTCNYTGVDIVQSVVDTNTLVHARPYIQFRCADFSDPGAMRDLLAPGYDLVLCKDVLQHWSDAEIAGWLRVVRTSSRFNTMLVTNNWKYHRTPARNGTARDINNPYRWAPIDMTQYDCRFKPVLYYPAGKFKQVCRLDKGAA